MKKPLPDYFFTDSLLQEDSIFDIKRINFAISYSIPKMAKLQPPIIIHDTIDFNPPPPKRIITK
jgi:hypothetical protein